MKDKLLYDFIVYIISPVLLLNLINISTSKFFVLALSSILLIYTIIMRKKESRINISGIMFSATYILMLLFRKEIQADFSVYIYDTYCIILLTLIIILSMISRRNIFKQVYIDIRRCKGDNSLRIFNNIKKMKLNDNFKNISYIVISHLSALSLIRIFSIYGLGSEGYTSTTTIQVIINVVFIICEMYVISKTMSNIKINTKIKKKRLNIKNTHTNSRVIDIQEYKNMNK